MMKGQIAGLMRQAQQMQDDLERAQREVSAMTFTAQSGGDLYEAVLLLRAYNTTRVKK